ncbi:glycoside hydrolase family 43 protein [Mahella australiensis]|uniref:Glycoside hydrolase family 43 n=1 Tax=Mahella australiensis (strain DSM 15567 / CIP 107919 / 50-1 BON) TaxID=697281 RepID=F3ZWG9_MAHA5|nr:glycoside hydrolase family 43 protein [Mahella australiensis]AEE95404.1 glycoside hydrolase family 43 [Mahella australiensis 50-1 BON]
MNKKVKTVLLLFVIVALVYVSASYIKQKEVKRVDANIVQGKYVLNSSKSSAIKSRFYSNPLPINNIGDPFVLKASDGKYYCYATSAPNGYKVWMSFDLVNWEYKGMSFTRDLNSWAIGDFWAPEVIEYQEKYYMFFSARELRSNSLRIGVAVAESPLGPFKDILNKPLFDFGYATIDASPFIDEDGEKYLYFSKDCSENVVNGVHESHIYGIKLSDDMMSTVGQPILLMRPDQDWEKLSGDAWRWNEGPIIFKDNETYYMFYSANYYGDATYSVGYATSRQPLGPFVKSKNNPILRSVTDIENSGMLPIVSGPGHNSFAVSPDNKEIFIVYHTHTNPAEGGGDRQLNIDRMGFRSDGTVYVNGPSFKPQPLPSGVDGIDNIAPEANVSVSSIKPGYKSEALVDGEVGFTKESENYDWVPNNETKGSWVCLEWDKESYIDTVIIYLSHNRKRTFNTAKLIINNNAVINVDTNADEDKFGNDIIINFEPMKIKNIKFVIDNVPNDVQEIGLSEIRVMPSSTD